MSASVETVAAVTSAGHVLITLVMTLVCLALFIVIWFKAARNMAKIAADKGYTERKWFHYCFWLGLIGYLMVCAMPDRNREKT